MSSASRVGPSLGARVDVVWKGCGTFRGTVVEGEDASKCWVLCYNDDGLCCALGRRRYTVVEDEADVGPQNTRARTGGKQDVHSKVTAGAGVGNINMLQRLPHFLMLCGAATQRKTGIATLLAGEDVMRLDMANAFFVRYRGREALQRGLKRYEYLFAIMSAFEQWRAVKRGGAV